MKLCPIAKAAKTYPEDLAVVDKSGDYSYSRLNEMVAYCQLYLSESGLSSGDRVGIICDNSSNYIAFLFAIWRMEAIAFPLNPSTPDNELRTRFSDSDTAFLICNKEKFDRSDFKNIKLIDLDIDILNIRKTEKTVNLNINENNNSLLIQTSGSSSESKIVVLSFSNLYYSAMGVLDMIELQRGDKWLLSLPLFHVGGLGVLMRCVIKAAGIVIYNKKKSLLEEINGNNITHLSLVTTQLYKLINDIKIQKAKDLIPGIKSILLGGSSVPNELLKEALEFILPVYVSYGLSEMGSTVAIKRVLSNEINFRSSGKVLKFREIHINIDGEILLKGATLFQGYLKNGKINVSVDKHGWFKTRDLGYLNENNELVLTGRRDNMFISGGENIQPEEIERILLEIPEIIESKVFPIEDKKFGFRPVAFLKIKDDNLPDEELIKKYLNQKLAKFKLPDSFYPWPETDSGKIKPAKKDFEDYLKNISF